MDLVQNSSSSLFFSAASLYPLKLDVVLSLSSLHLRWWITIGDDDDDVYDDDDVDDDDDENDDDDTIPLQNHLSDDNVIL